MNDNFCQALIEKNRKKLEIIVNEFLATLEVHMSADHKFQLIKEWIEEHNCVVKAEFDSSFIDTDPPIKEFVISLQGIPQLYFIGIRVSHDQMKFDIKQP